MIPVSSPASNCSSTAAGDRSDMLRMCPAETGGKRGNNQSLNYVSHHRGAVQYDVAVSPPRFLLARAALCATRHRQVMQTYAFEHRRQLAIIHAPQSICNV